MTPNIEGFSFLEAENNNKAHKAGKGVLTIVNAQRTGCGQRLVISKQLQNQLQITESIQLLISDDGKFLLLGKNISDKATSYKMRLLKKDNPNSKLVLYNSAVVNEITKKMNLCFDETVSITFYGIELIAHGDTLLAKLSLQERGES